MVVDVLLNQLVHFGVPQILMTNFWYNQYIFCHLLNFEAHIRNNMVRINLPLFHGMNAIEFLKPNKFVGIVSCGESIWILFCFMAMYPLFKFACNACVKNAVVSVGCYVGPGFQCLSSAGVMSSLRSCLPREVVH